MELKYLSFEFAHNQLGFVRNGLILAKIKFLKLYKNYGDGTFASFCREQLRKQRWQINDTIKAARVVLELMYAGFDILPTNVSQAVTLAKLTGEELIEKWRSVIETIPLDKITAKSIRNFVFPQEEDKAVTTIKVPAKVHEDIHREASERGMSIVELLVTMLDFFINSENSHLLQHEIDMIDYADKKRIWREDLAKITANA
ncbi:MAG: hypothetical protein QNJ32_28290 [Xenococcaceae cyanobacterium MO_167.B27]|nr:hypothetical protein [Xenococcaceae cyanobacterium MO_167.B27]